MAFGKKKNVQTPSNDDFMDFGYDDGGFGGGDSFQGGTGGDSFGYGGGGSYGGDNFGGDSFGVDDFGGGTGGGNVGGGRGGSRNHGGFGKVLIPIVAVLVVVILAGSIYGALVGATRGQCKQVLETFEDGCNELDFMKIADVIDPSYRNAIKAIAMVASGALSSDAVEQLAQLIDKATGGFLSQAANGEGLSNVLRSVKIEPMRFGLPGKSRVVKCKVSAGVFSAYINVTIKKKHREAYIAKIEIAKE